MATKYLALVSLPALVLCAAWRGKDWKEFQMISSACIATAAACVVTAPMYLRNWILLGSPIYPPPAGAANFLHVKYYCSRTEGILRIFRLARKRPGPRTPFVFTPAIQP